MGKAFFPYATVAKLEIHEMILFHKVQTYPFKPGLNKTKISLSSLTEKLFSPSKRCNYNWALYSSAAQNLAKNWAAQNLAYH